MTQIFGSGASSSGTISFTVDTQVDYVFSGQYSAVDPEGAEGGEVVFQAFLWDDALGQYVFANSQRSWSTPNESFVLGLMEGDYLNLLSGSATGTLLPGHEYSVSFGAWINTLELVTDPGATATGTLSLTFVPEPASLLLLASGIAALAWREGRSARRAPRHD